MCRLFLDSATSVTIAGHCAPRIVHSSSSNIYPPCSQTPSAIHVVCWCLG